MDLNWCKMGADIMRSSTYGEFIVNKLRVIIACPWYDSEHIIWLAHNGLKWPSLPMAMLMPKH